MFGIIVHVRISKNGTLHGIRCEGSGVWGMDIPRPKSNPGIQRVPFFGLSGLIREPKP